MKKTTLLLSLFAFLFVSNKTKAQLINSDFETWSADLSVPTEMNPNTGNNTFGWWDYNFFNSSFGGSSPISVKRCTDTVHGGLYSCRIQAVKYTPTSYSIYKYAGVGYIGHPYSDTLGIVYNGKIDESGSSYAPGIAYNQKITQYKFYYQFRPNGSDTAECRVSLRSGGTLVAGGTFKTGVATGAAGWQLATINMTYISALTPDTMYVLFSAASLDHTPKPGSVLWIDDISVTLPTGISGVAEETNFAVFPNPSKGVFSLQQHVITNEETVEVYNLLGEKIYSAINNKQEIFNIDISKAPKGIYFVKTIDGDKIRTKKIIVQ
jgi:hypothetical protein